MSNEHYWLQTAKRGENKVYHVGYLPLDESSYFQGQAVMNWDVINRAKLAWNAYTSKLVHLKQRRLGPFKYEYIMEKR